MSEVTFGQAFIINVKLWEKSLVLAFFILITILSLIAFIQMLDFINESNTLIRNLHEAIVKLTSFHNYSVRFLGFIGSVIAFYSFYQKPFISSLKKQYKTLPTNLEEKNYANLRFYYFRILSPIVDFIINILIDFLIKYFPYTTLLQSLFLEEENYKTFQLEFIENQPNLKFYLKNCLLNYTLTILAVSSVCCLFFDFSISQSVLSQLFLTEEFPGKAWVFSLPLNVVLGTFILQWQLNQNTDKFKVVNSSDREEITI